MSEPPIPAMTRPIIKAFIFGAPPHRTLPTSKRAIEAMYTYFISNML
jgi:hypothetical protein